jgi:protein transport protein SEC13
VETQWDYYAKRLATCSSDRTIRIFDVTGDVYNQSAVLPGHDGPVWEVAWAHPKYGVLLASCSYDGQVIVHRESSPGAWQKIHVQKVHGASVNSISWAPHEYGLILACASSDGKVSIIEHQQDDSWSVREVISNDNMGCNAVSWAPFSAVGSLTSDGRSTMRLVTGSCNNCVQVWRYDSEWRLEEMESEQAHVDWVRDVAWAPNTGLPYNVIASCGEDGRLCIWEQKEESGVLRKWTPLRIYDFDVPVWRLSWSITGNVLAVSTGDHKVSLWKQDVDGKWVSITSLDDAQEAESQG